MFFEIGIFFGDRDDNDISRFKFIVQFLQLTQLLGTERSPMRTISGEDDVRLAQVIIERDSRAVCTWKGKGLGVLADLQPDQVVYLGFDGTSRCIERPIVSRPVSFRRRLRIERGRKRDYDSYSALHYRPSEQLGLGDRLYVTSG